MKKKPDNNIQFPVPEPINNKTTFCLKNKGLKWLLT